VVEVASLPGNALLRLGQERDSFAPAMAAFLWRAMRRWQRRKYDSALR
jgi:hypothetical protein